MLALIESHDQGKTVGLAKLIDIPRSVGCFVIQNSIFWGISESLKSEKTRKILTKIRQNKNGYRMSS